MHRSNIDPKTNTGVLGKFPVDSECFNTPEKNPTMVVGWFYHTIYDILNRVWGRRGSHLLK